MKRYQIECTASQTIKREASTLQGVLWHLSRMQGRVSVVDTKDNNELVYGDAFSAYNFLVYFRRDLWCA
jgi:hypothetical protein